MTTSIIVPTLIKGHHTDIHGNRGTISGKPASFGQSVKLAGTQIIYSVFNNVTFSHSGVSPDCCFDVSQQQIN